MRENGALGKAGGAGGVDERGGGVAIDGGGSGRARRGHVACGEIGGLPDRHAVDGREIFRRGDDGAGGGIGNDVGDLALAIKNVDRYKDDAGFDAGQVEVDEFERVEEIDAEAVSGREATAQQQVGEAVGALVDFAEGVLAALPLESHGLAAAEQRQVKEMGQVHGAWISNDSRSHD